MGLNEAKGNMYEWVTHTWNTVKGECRHNCSYCYMKRWGKQNPVRFDEIEMKTDLGRHNFIFVGSSCDMFADDIPAVWIHKTLNYIYGFENTYLFQSKNPKKMLEYKELMPFNTRFCTTIESNRHYPEIMRKSPTPIQRALSMENTEGLGLLTIEPILDFDILEFMKLIAIFNPEQINIGADSGNNKLPEPSKEDLNEFINRLKMSYKVVLKPNLKRLL